MYLTLTLWQCAKRHRVDPSVKRLGTGVDQSGENIQTSDLTYNSSTRMELNFSCYPSIKCPTGTYFKMHDKYSTYPRSKHTVPVNDDIKEPGKWWSKDVSLLTVTYFSGTVSVHFIATVWCEILLSFWFTHLTYSFTIQYEELKTLAYLICICSALPVHWNIPPLWQNRSSFPTRNWRFGFQ